MKKTVYMLIIVLTLTLCFGTVCHAARSEVMIDENYEKLNTGVSLDTLEGWRTKSDYDLKTLFKAAAKDDAIHITYGTRTATWETMGTQFYRDIPDFGEGIYEISFRFNAENFTNSIPRLFNPHGYVENADGTRTEKCLIYTNFGALQFKDGEKTTLKDAVSSACPKTEKKWIDFKYTIDTVKNEATVAHSIDGDEWKSASGPIGEADGLSYLLLDVRFGTAAVKDTEEHTAAMAGEYYFDDVKVVYCKSKPETTASPVKAVLANEIYDNLSSENIPVQALDGWSRVKADNYYYVFGVETVSDDSTSDGKMMRIKPRKTSTWWNGANHPYHREIPNRGEGIYEFSYRLNFENMYSYFYDIFSVYAYLESDTTGTPKSVLSFSLNNSKGKVNYPAVFLGFEYEQTKNTSTAFEKDTWYDFFYKVDTVNNQVEFSYKKTSDAEWTETFTLSIPAKFAMSAPAYLKLRPGYYLASDDTDHSKALEGTFSFDDLLITHDAYLGVADTYPEQDSEGVDVWDTEIKLAFNMPMDEKSLTPYSILVYEGNSPKPMGVDEYTVEASLDKVGNSVATVRFTKPLSYATAYRVEVLADSVYTPDLIRPNEDFTLNFTTGPLPTIQFSFFDGNNNPVTSLADVAGRLVYIRMNIFE